MNRIRFTIFLLLLSAAAHVSGAGGQAGSSVPGPDATAAAAGRLPVESFLALDAFDTIKISPDGVHIAATVPMEGRMMLVFLRLSDLKQTGGVTLTKGGEVDDFVWVNARQVVYSASEKNGSLASPRANPYLYLANADGSEGRIVNKDRQHFLIDELRDDDDHILVGPGIRKIKLSNGQSVENMLKGYGPTESGSVYPDSTGNGRVDVGTIANERKTRLYARIGPNGDQRDDWQLINDGNATGLQAGMLGYSGDNKTAYLQIEEWEGPDGVYGLDMATGERTLVYRHPRVDPYTVLKSPLTGAVVALVHRDGKPVVHVIDPEDEYAKELLKMTRAFPGSYVFPTSFTRDGSKGIYLVWSDVNSGEFYLVDHARGKADYIAERQMLMLPSMMSPMQPFRFRARDGAELEGFLTQPVSRQKGRPVPLVVVPHGGPKGPYDAWGFDSENQLLASRGYAVLQVNFRGSGNYGRAFLDSGNRQWGSGMIDDIIDATRWAIAEGHAAPGRICLYGASYGAYASMVAVAREPSLYACAIGNVGVYDIRRLVAEDSLGQSKRIFNELFGAGADLDAISPTSFPEKIRVPVLLGAGEKDRVAPPGHTDQMLRQLRKAGVDVQHVEYEGEAHGNYLLKNRADWARRVLALLDRTIGGGAPAAVAANQEL